MNAWMRRLSARWVGSVDVAGRYLNKYIDGGIAPGSGVSESTVGKCLWRSSVASSIRPVNMWFRMSSGRNEKLSARGQRQGSGRRAFTQLAHGKPFFKGAELLFRCLMRLVAWDEHHCISVSVCLSLGRRNTALLHESACSACVAVVHQVVQHEVFLDRISTVSG